MANPEVDLSHLRETEELFGPYRSLQPGDSPDPSHISTLGLIPTRRYGQGSSATDEAEAGETVQQ